MIVVFSQSSSYPSSNESAMVRILQTRESIFPCQVAQSDGAKLRSCHKSKLAYILERDATCPDNKPDAIGIFTDGCKTVNKNGSCIKFIGYWLAHYHL